MDKNQEIMELLNSKNIEYRERGDELIMHCLFNNCDEDSRGTEAHLYMNKYTGLYDCKKCHVSGNLITLKRHFGIEPTKQARRSADTTDQNKLAIRYHAALPVAIWEYLRGARLLPSAEIASYQLGYIERNDGRWITIPVTDRSGHVLFFKLRRDPATEGKPKYMSTGGDATIFNAQILRDKPEKLVICEGEFDCLVLHSMGIPAICSTAGAGTFKDEWVAQLGFVRDYYVVMDNDEAGRKGAENLTEKLGTAYPNSSVMRVTLPPEVGEHGDITDYFKQKLGTTDDLFEPTGKHVQLAAGTKPIDVAHFTEMSLQDVIDTLALTIKNDDDNKLLTFLAMLSAYTDSSQLNVSFNAPSSTGKTYTATQVADLFPEADKIELSGASPTSFFHGEGVVDKDREAKIVSLERKILLFYEQPNPDLQAKLRAVLSHDKRELNYRITNKDKKGANRAELIIVRGYPATVFCSAGLRLDEQETTRAILLSSDVSQEKIRAGMHLQAQRGANSAEFHAWLESQPLRIALKNRILAIKREQVDDIIVPNPDEILRRFNDKFKQAKPRHMRDVGHLMSLIKSAALLNVWHRRQPDGLIIAKQSDIDQVFNLWGRLIESQDMSVPPAVMRFYKMFILTAFAEKLSNPDYSKDMEERKVGLSRQELSSYHFRKEGTPLNDEQLRKQILPQLEASGMIVQLKPEKGDKRSPHIFPIWYPEGVKDPLDRNNDGMGGGDVDISEW